MLIKLVKNWHDKRRGDDNKQVVPKGRVIEMTEQLGAELIKDGVAEDISDTKDDFQKALDKEYASHGIDTGTEPDEKPQLNTKK